MNLKSHNNIPFLRMRGDFISNMVLNVKLTGKHPTKWWRSLGGEWGKMSYRSEDKEKDLREATVGDALVARRPTQNESLSREKKKKGGGKKDDNT